MRKVEKLFDRNLRPSIKLERISINVFIYIAKESYTRLLLVKKRSEDKCVNPHDRLGMNSSQFVQELYKPHLVLFI